MIAKVEVVRGFKFSEPKPDWPRLGVGGQILLMPFEVARVMTKDGLVKVRDYVTEPSDPEIPSNAQVEAAREALDAAMAGERAVMTELGRVQGRLETLKKDRVTVPPNEIEALEAEHLKLERTQATLRQRLRSASVKVSPLRQKYQAMNFSRTLAEAKETVTRKIDPLATKFVKQALDHAEKAVGSVAASSMHGADVPEAFADALLLLRDALDRAVAHAQGLKGVAPDRPRLREPRQSDALPDQGGASSARLMDSMRGRDL